MSRNIKNNKSSALPRERISEKSRVHAPKRVLSSKSIDSITNRKSCSTGKIYPKKNEIIRPKKTTKSEQTFQKDLTHKQCHDYCKNCGDTRKNKSSLSSKCSQDSSANEWKPIVTETLVQNCDSKKGKIRQYYKNENFNLSLNSQNNKKENSKGKLTTLDPIKEVTETFTSLSDKAKSLNLKETNYVKFSSDDSEDDTQSESDDDSVKEVKYFRSKNYFECHNPKTRLKRGKSLKKHECTYSFYLNERLFPVPLYTDHEDNIRCMKCSLPVDLHNGNENSNNENNCINGTIQAKVALGSDSSSKDITLLLPVKSSLIIKEKRKEKKTDDEVLYFGVIKLDSFGNSLFQNNLPSDSFALRYQKGYKEFDRQRGYVYKEINEDDQLVII